MINEKETIRTYQKKFSGNSEGTYNFEDAHKIQEYLGEPLIIVKGFIKESNFGRQLTMLVEKEDGTLITVKSGSAVLTKQFEEEVSIGLPVKVKVISAEGKSGRTYFTFAMPEENIE